MHASTLERIPPEERSVTTIAITVSHLIQVTVMVGGLDMTNGANRVTLFYTVRDAACEGIDGRCVATSALGRRQLQTAGGFAMIEIDRTFQYASSPNVGVPVDQMINAALAVHSLQVTDVTTMALSALTVVTTQGTTDSSAVDDALASTSVLNRDLNRVWLPSASGGTTVTVGDSMLAQPPSPPLPPPPPPLVPPPPPLLPAAGRSGMGRGETIAVAIVTVAVTCLLSGFLLVWMRRRHNRKLRVAADEQAAQRAGGQRSRTEVYQASRSPRAEGGCGRAEEATRPAAAQWANSSSDDDDESVDHGFRTPNTALRAPAVHASSGGLLASVLSDPHAASATPGFDTSPSQAALPMRSASGRLVHQAPPSRAAPALSLPASSKALLCAKQLTRPLAQSSLQLLQSSGSVGTPSQGPGTNPTPLGMASSASKPTPHYGLVREPPSDAPSITRQASTESVQESEVPSVQPQRLAPAINRPMPQRKQPARYMQSTPNRRVKASDAASSSIQPTARDEQSRHVNSKAVRSDAAVLPDATTRAAEPKEDAATVIQRIVRGNNDRLGWGRFVSTGEQAGEDKKEKAVSQVRPS